MKPFLLLPVDRKHVSNEKTGDGAKSLEKFLYVPKGNVKTQTWYFSKISSVKKRGWGNNLLAVDEWRNHCHLPLHNIWLLLPTYGFFLQHSGNFPTFLSAHFPNPEFFKTPRGVLYHFVSWNSFSFPWSLCASSLCLMNAYDNVQRIYKGKELY